MGALHAKELALGYFCISEVVDGVGNHFVDVVKVVPFANIVGECPSLDDGMH